MTHCPSCGVRPEIDLRQIHFRDLGFNPALACPECGSVLTVLEIDTTPRAHIERCGSCQGLFFNPGELEAALDAQSNPLVWLDRPQLNQIADDFDAPRTVVYRPCPVCREMMGHQNFAGRSGVILDRCGSHGVWLKGSELRRLSEWWRSGGRIQHQRYEWERVRQIGAPGGGARQPKSRGTVTSPAPADHPWPSLPDSPFEPLEIIFDVLRYMFRPH